MPEPHEESPRIQIDTSASTILATPKAVSFANTKIKLYPHLPNIIPPYVLDGLSQAHYKDQLDNSNVNVNHNESMPTARRKQTNTHVDDEEQYASFQNDPFIKSLGTNQWQNFLSTIKQPTGYTSDLVNLDHGLIQNDEEKLSGTWGGDDRLKLALLGTPSSDEDTYVDEKPGFFRRMFGMKSSSSSKSNKDGDHTRVRSKAGYWMSDEKRADVLPFFKRMFVQDPLVPLLLRILIIICSACALSLACTVFVKSRRKYDGQHIEQQASTIMAIVVQCCAIAYLTYIGYDEYSGKPLGLRDPLGKMKLIMLDLLFIIFSSANLSLAFNTLYDKEWVCQNDNTEDLQKIGIYYPTVFSICRRQRALSAFLFLSLCLWVLTFAISIVRVVDRVSVATPRNN